MFKVKDVRDIGTTVLALGTAWGLGVLSCVYFELKLLAEYRRNEPAKRQCRNYYKEGSN